MRIVLTTLGSFGDLNPYLGLGRALQARGHQPVLAVTPAYLPYVEAAGLEGHPVRPDGDPSERAVVARIMDPMRGAEFLVKDLLMPHLRDTYDDLAEAARNADAVVSHPLTLAAPVLCEKRGLPWAASMLAPLSFFSRRDPPLMAPGPTVAAIHRRWPRLAAPVNAIGLRLSRQWTRPVEALRASLGLRRGRNPLGDGQFSPYQNLGLFSKVLGEPQPDWPPHTTVTGAVRYDAVRGTMSDELAQFLDAGPPPVVFTLGTSAVDANRAPHFFDVSAAAASALGVRAVLLVGRAPENRPSIASGHVFVADWAPHSELFPRAAAVVHQGGAGTLHTTMAAGRPMLIVPFAHDQPDNAIRAWRLGIARVLYPQQYSAARVQAALGTLLSNGHIAEAVAEVFAAVSQEDGAHTASQALEGLELATGSAGPTGSDPEPRPDRPRGRQG